MKSWLIAVLAALMVAGCSQGKQKGQPAGNPTDPAASSTTTHPKREVTDAEMRAAGASEQSISTLRLLQGKRWQKSEKVDPMDGHKEVSFQLYAQPIYEGWQNKKDIGVLIMIECGGGFAVGAGTGAVAHDHVRVRFDDGPIQSQRWFQSSGVLMSRHSKELLKELLAAKTMKFEYTPEGSDAQVYELSVLNLKDLMAQEPSCKL